MSVVDWKAAAREQRLSRPARLLAEALADRADRHRRVSAPLGLVASCCCLSETDAADAVAELVDSGLLTAVAGGTHVLRSAAPEPKGAVH